MKYVFILIIGIFLFSCKKDKKAPTSTTPTSSSPANLADMPNLDVVVKDFYEDKDKQKADSIVPNAEVKLFINATDREADTNHHYFGTTDSKGKVSFKSLRNNFYYVRIYHQNLSVLYESIDCPDKSTSLLNAYYPY